MQAAGQGLLVRETLLPMGALTVVAAAFFLLRQQDIKRLLAYSSMENVGVMAVAIALGSSAGFALQAVNHSMLKVALFLIAGNLMQQFGTKKIRELHGLLDTQPAQGVLLFLLVVAVAGTPPFGSFLAEWQILAVAADHHNIGAVIALLIGLALSFVALSIQVNGVLFGKRNESGLVKLRFGAFSLSVVPALLLTASLFLGIALTPRLFALAGGLAR
jgi:hydrogenase-4 component F